MYYGYSKGVEEGRVQVLNEDLFRDTIIDKQIIKEINIMDHQQFEDAVKKIIKDYGAPENITEAIEDFLFGSGNLYSIAELARGASISNLQKDINTTEVLKEVMNTISELSKELGAMAKTIKK